MSRSGSGTDRHLTNLAVQNFAQLEVLRRRVLLYRKLCHVFTGGFQRGTIRLSVGCEKEQGFMREQLERGSFFRANDSIRPIWE
jgi:hypothetical protein